MLLTGEDRDALRDRLYKSVRSLGLTSDDAMGGDKRAGNRDFGNHVSVVCFLEEVNEELDRQCEPKRKYRSDVLLWPKPTTTERAGLR